jgi:hypothetical protein
MKTRYLHRLAPLSAALILLAVGCDENPTALDNDLSAIQELILEEADFFTADLFSAEGAEDPDTPVPGRILTDIVPWRWGRQILEVVRNIEISIDDSADPATASVTWNATLNGLFHIIDTTGTAYSKDLEDNAVRYATFSRSGNPDGPRRGWRLTSISGTTIVSNPNTVSITGVHLTTSGGLDTTFTDVSTLVAKEDVPVFTARDTIMVTVTTGNDDDIVLIHYPAWATGHNNRHHVRRRMRNNGDGTYSTGWVARGYVWRNGQLRNPARHVTIEVLSRSTIFDDVAPYDSVAWGMVYRVAIPDGS